MSRSDIAPRRFLALSTILVILMIMWMLGACVNGPAPRLVPLAPQEPTPMQWDSVLPHLIGTADGFIVGTITGLEADWTYDDPCGLIAIVLHRCDGTVTYRLHIENDLTDKYLWAFTPATGAFGLFHGERAIFIWQVLPIYRYKECREHAGMSGYCQTDLLPVLTDDLDVLPIEDSLRVATLFGSVK